jgi:hypothetical protein
MSEGRRLSPLSRNPISYFGGVLTAGAAVLTLLALLSGFVLGGANPYVGILTFLVLPAFMILGFLLVLFGMMLESRRRRRAVDGAAAAYPDINLNDPATRRRFAIALVSGFLFIVLLAVVGYHAFEFTESITFCGKICHSVMEPEHTAYLASPHARVSCVECHVGSGAGWYVKSKLSGVRQVFAVLFNSYSRPIEVPIRDLRPARETCEQCHWPQKFYGAQLLQIPYFRYDEANTSDQISMLIKTGGGSARLGQSAGIHWHMLIESSVSYATPDPKLQEIPYFKVKGSDGKTREYMSKDKPLTEKELAALEPHTMDCVDCHNRPTHIYTAPDRAVDLSMNNGLVPRDLPWIKKTLAEAIMAEYPDRDAAASGIRDRVLAFYGKSYPELARSRGQDLEQAARTAADIYRRSVFPKMKVDWHVYPDNIGHRNWPGCFRCHDGRHISNEGKILTRSCTACHTMPQRGPLESLGALPPVTDETWHPFPLKGRHEEILCNRCHRPGIRPKLDCAGCHKKPADAPMMADCTTCHASPGVKLPLADCKSCHEKLPGLHSKGGHPDAACTDCHKPHGWKVSGRDACLACHDDKKDHEKEAQDCASCHEFGGKS